MGSLRRRILAVLLAAVLAVSVLGTSAAATQRSVSNVSAEAGADAVYMTWQCLLNSDGGSGYCIELMPGGCSRRVHVHGAPPVCDAPGQQRVASEPTVVPVGNPAAGTANLWDLRYASTSLSDDYIRRRSAATRRTRTGSRCSATGSA